MKRVAKAFAALKAAVEAADLSATDAEAVAMQLQDVATATRAKCGTNTGTFLVQLAEPMVITTVEPVAPQRPPAADVTRVAQQAPAAPQPLRLTPDQVRSIQQRAATQQPQPLRLTPDQVRSIQQRAATQQPQPVTADMMEKIRRMVGAGGGPIRAGEANDGNRS